MRVLNQPSLALLTTVLLSSTPSLTSALGFSCGDVRVDNVRFDLRPLGGVHEIYNATHLDGYTVNTTYLINICGILGGAARFEGANCGTSKSICGFERTIYDDDEDGHAAEVRPLPIAGLDPAGGGSKDPEVTRLKKQDADTEGVRIKIAGGEIHEHGQKHGKPASAVIEFQCDHDRTGLEGLSTEEVDDSSETERRSKRKAKRVRRDKDEDDDDDNEEEEGDEEGDGEEETDSGADDEQDTSDRSLQLKSFGLVDDKYYILRLDWRTKYACENYLSENPDSSGGSHWGFFTWLIIIAFLLVAAYLIFGSWLNYNRYGARGWDLLPHGDTIRDIPYIFQDWLRRVINTLQGPGARGGYAAV